MDFPIECAWHCDRRVNLRARPRFQDKVGIVIGELGICDVGAEASPSTQLPIEGEYARAHHR